LSEAHTRSVGVQKSALGRERRPPSRATGPSTETKRAFVGPLAESETPKASNRLPRSAFDPPRAAHHAISSASEVFSLQRSSRDGAASGAGARSGAGTVDPTSETARPVTTGTTSAAQHLGSAADVMGGIPENREIVMRLDAMTQEVVMLSTRIGALEKLVERSLGQPPWRRLSSGRHET